MKEYLDTTPVFIYPATAAHLAVVRGGPPGRGWAMRDESSIGTYQDGWPEDHFGRFGDQALNGWWTRLGGSPSRLNGSAPLDQADVLDKALRLGQLAQILLHEIGHIVFERVFGLGSSFSRRDISDSGDVVRLSDTCPGPEFSLDSATQLYVFPRDTEERGIAAHWALAMMGDFFEGLLSHQVDERLSEKHSSCCQQEWLQPPGVEPPLFYWPRGACPLDTRPAPSFG